MSYLITTTWVALTSIGLLLDGPIFNVAAASVIIVALMLVATMFIFMGCIAAKRYDAISSLPKRNAFLRAIGIVVDLSPGVAIAGIGHPILGAGYICLYGVARIIVGLCRAVAKSDVK